MTQQTQANPTPTKTAPEKKSGFFSRLFSRIDEGMKKKAEKQSGNSCCGGDDKGGKCC